MTMYKALYSRDDIDRECMYQEKEEEEDSSAFKIASMQRLEDYKKGAYEDWLLSPETIHSTQASTEQK